MTPGARFAGRRLRRFVPGLAVTSVGLAPFLIAGLAWHRQESEIAGVGLIGDCPLRELTGMPCIGCGGARAFYYFTHGDADFLSYNWFWPLAMIVAVGYGVFLLARTARGEEPFGTRVRAIGRRYATEPVRMALITLAVLTLPWFVALGNLDAIRSG